MGWKAAGRGYAIGFSMFHWIHHTVKRCGTYEAILGQCTGRKKRQLIYAQ
jgi:hypothetical protein